jgi:hypothetical protein
MENQHIHNTHDAMEGWETQYREASKLPEWNGASQEEKSQILLQIIRKAPYRAIPNDEGQALALCGE